MPSDTGLIVLNGLQGNAPASLLPMQKMLLPYLSTIEHVLFIAWWMILAYVAISVLVSHGAPASKNNTS